MRGRPASGRTILLSLGAAAVVAVLAIVAGVLAVHFTSEPEPPEVTFYVHGESVRTGPVKYCSLTLTDCVGNPKPHLDAPVGSPVQISLPEQISQAPWTMTVEYLGPGDRSEYALYAFPPNARRAVTVGGGDRQILTIEINLPSAVVTAQGAPFSRGYWALDTTPSALLKGHSVH